MLELLLALTVTSLIGLVAFTLSMSVTRGTQHRAQMHATNITRVVVSERLDAALRSARMILATGSNHLILWMSDTQGNGKPDLSEICRLQWHADTQEVWFYRAPADLDPAQDVAYEIDSDFEAITALLAGTAVFPGELWARSVTGWGLALNLPDPQAATLAQYTLTIADSNGNAVVTGTNALRGR